MTLLLRLLTRGRRRVLIHRRGLAALCLAVAAWSALTVLKPSPPPQVALWSAAHDLPGGTRLRPGDLRRAHLPAGSEPSGSVRRREQLVGATTSGPVGRGEVLTRTRLLGPGHLRGHPGRTAVGLRIPDTEVADLLRPGDHVDLVGSDPQEPGRAVPVAHDAVVLAVPRARGDPVATNPGRLVVFAVPEASAAQVASTGSALFLTVLWSR